MRALRVTPLQSHLGWGQHADPLDQVALARDAPLFSPLARGEIHRQPGENDRDLLLTLHVSARDHVSARGHVSESVRGCPRRPHSPRSLGRGSGGGGHIPHHTPDFHYRPRFLRG